MKKLLLICLVLLLAVGLTSAGERMTKAGTHSLNFNMNGLGDFGVSSAVAGWNGARTQYGFGGSYFVQDDMAIRAGIGVNRYNQNTKGTTTETDYTEMGFGIYPALLWYCMGEGSVSGYWGPTAYYSMYSEETETTGGTTTVNDKDSWTGFGFGVVMGAQWWAWNQVAFNAEYILSYDMYSSKQESGGTSVDGPDVSGFGISSWSVGLGLFFNR